MNNADEKELKAVLTGTKKRIVVDTLKEIKNVSVGNKRRIVDSGETPIEDLLEELRFSPDQREFLYTEVGDFLDDFLILSRSQWENLVRRLPAGKVRRLQRSIAYIKHNFDDSMKEILNEIRFFAADAEILSTRIGNTLEDFQSLTDEDWRTLRTDPICYKKTGLLKTTITGESIPSWRA